MTIGDANEALPGELFHFEDGEPSFEDLGQENGFRFWWASDLMGLLGYSNWSSFCQVVNKAIAAATTAKIQVIDNFVQDKRKSADGKEINDFKLSKFGCYMVSMNGDPKIAEVAKAQAYFATVAEGLQKYIRSCEDVERVQIRGELSEQEGSLSRCASSYGVENYAFFRNAGYLGLYNMSLKELRAHKGMDSKNTRTLYDFMGKRELAANLFRITETEARIESSDVRGQRALERTAKTVGSEVRQTMTQEGGIAPEDLALETDVKKISTDLRRTSKQIDSTKK